MATTLFDLLFTLENTTKDLTGLKRVLNEGKTAAQIGKEFIKAEANISDLVEDAASDVDAVEGLTAVGKNVPYVSNWAKPADTVLGAMKKVLKPTADELKKAKSLLKPVDDFLGDSSSDTTPSPAVRAPGANIGLIMALEAIESVFNELEDCLHSQVSALKDAAAYKLKQIKVPKSLDPSVKGLNQVQKTLTMAEKKIKAVESITRALNPIVAIKSQLEAASRQLGMIKKELAPIQRNVVAIKKKIKPYEDYIADITGKIKKEVDNLLHKIGLSMDKLNILNTALENYEKKIAGTLTKPVHQLTQSLGKLPGAAELNQIATEIEGVETTVKNSLQAFIGDCESNAKRLKKLVHA